MVFFFVFVLTLYLNNLTYLFMNHSMERERFYGETPKNKYVQGYVNLIAAVT